MKRIKYCHNSYMKCVVFFSVLTITLWCENWRVANTQTVADSETQTLADTGRQPDTEDENLLHAAQVSNLCSTFLFLPHFLMYSKTTILISAVSKTSEILVG